MPINDKEINEMLTNKRVSILTNHKKDIIKMRDRGVSLNNIQQWLKKNYQLKTSTENIRQFCIRNNLRNGEAKIEKKPLENKKTTDNNKKKLFENLTKD